MGFDYTYNLFSYASNLGFTDIASFFPKVLTTLVSLPSLCGTRLTCGMTEYSSFLYLASLT
jgi:hypothetical protein